MATSTINLTVSLSDGCGQAHHRAGFILAVHLRNRLASHGRERGCRSWTVYRAENHGLLSGQLRSSGTDTDADGQSTITIDDGLISQRYTALIIVNRSKAVIPLTILATGAGVPIGTTVDWNVSKLHQHRDRWACIAGRWRATEVKNNGN